MGGTIAASPRVVRAPLDKEAASVPQALALQMREPVAPWVIRAAAEAIAPLGMLFAPPATAPRVVCPVALLASVAAGLWETGPAPPPTRSAAETRRRLLARPAVASANLAAGP